MKKTIIFLAYLLIPSIIFALYGFISEIAVEFHYVQLIAFFLVYILYIAGIILFIKYSYCSIWGLLIGFALPTLIAFIDDLIHPYNYQNFGFMFSTTAFCLFFYSLPFTIIIVIAWIFISYSRKKRLK